MTASERILKLFGELDSILLEEPRTGSELTSAWSRVAAVSKSVHEELRKIEDENLSSVEYSKIAIQHGKYLRKISAFYRRGLKTNG